MKALTPIFKGAGFDVPLYVCDPGSFGRGGVNPYGEEILRGRNGMSGGGGAEATYQQAAAIAGDFPVYSPEVYTAWFSAWGQPIATRNATTQAIVNSTNFFIDHNMSWCYFMFFGGTNWGYNTGCNEFLPLQTTYDYSAPIDEAGRTNEKFTALRNALIAKTGRTLPEPPPNPAVVELPPIKLAVASPLLNVLPATPTMHSVKPVSMENLNQAYGFVNYRKTFPNGIKGTLELRQAMDYTLTMVNGKRVGETFVGLPEGNNKITLNEAGPTTLDILVHNLGRVSVITSANSQWRAKKGLIGGAFLDGTELTDWDNYSLPTDPPLPAVIVRGRPHNGPTFYDATFNIDKPASTFLNLSNFGMGVVWVNGHNLGRYWDRGGSRSLFCSEHFLKPGANEITVLELHDAPKVPEIAGTTKMVETPPVPFPVKLDVNTLQVPGGPAPAGRGRGGPVQTTQPIGG
jgi:beta-galactosidase